MTQITLSDYIADRKRRAALAAALPTSPAVLYHLAKRWRGKRPSPQRAMQIERLTGGAVSKSSLRPDIWPEEASDVK